MIRNLLLFINFFIFTGAIFGQSISQEFSSRSIVTGVKEQVNLVSEIKLTGKEDFKNTAVVVEFEKGISVTDCYFYDEKKEDKFYGQLSVLPNGNSSYSISNLEDMKSKGSNKYSIVSVVSIGLFDDDEILYDDNSVFNVSFSIRSRSDNKNVSSSEDVRLILDVDDLSNLLFSAKESITNDFNLTNSWTVSAIDYDNDNDDDLFFTDATLTQPNRLYNNNGDGTFEEVKSGVLVEDIAKSMSSAWADFDNDGDLDVVIANSSMLPCTFFVNNGDGSFVKNTKASFTKNVGYYHHVSWVDVDNDGKLELYLGNYLPSRFNELWRQDDNGNWSLELDNVISQAVGSSVGGTWCDYDGDGYQDLLLLNNNGGSNRMYHNIGNGEFEEVFNEITNHGGYSVSSTWGDIDNDGDFDLFISNASDENNELYLNEGDGAFSLVVNGDVVSNGGHSHGASFVDIDKDLDLDLFVSNDQGKKFLYLNNGNGVFIKDKSEQVNSNFGKAFGVSFSDIDNDGDMDLISSTHGNDEDLIFKTNNNNNNWLKIRLEGTSSNQSAIGAKIRVKANGVWMTRFISSQNGIGGQNSYRQHFGLSDEDKVDIEVYWPSGYIQKLKKVRRNSNLVLVEPKGTETSLIAFHDENGNCSYDEGEQLLSGVKFAFGNELTTVTNDEGIAKINLSNKKYSISFDRDKYKTKCSVEKKVDVKNSSSIFVGYYPLIPLCEEADLDVTAYTVVLRRGFDSKYHIDVKNLGLKEAKSVSLTATLPSGIEVDSASVGWSNSSFGLNNETILTWDLEDITYNELNSLVLYFRVSLDAQLNDIIESSFSLTSSSQDCNKDNNSFIDIQTVVGSMDPNDLLVYPLGESEEHFIHNTDKLTYRIRFQNVGSYEADFVNIIDELPEGVDVNSISNIVASHRYQLTTEGNKLYFYFPEIYLPDSSSNLEGSNGFIQFTVDQKNDVVNGEVLSNKALIQFDYNEYIVTNSVYHTVIVDENEDTQGTLVLFPNPATDYSFARVSIANKIDPEINEIHVFSQNGEEVLSLTENSNVMRLDVSSLPSGLYFVKAVSIEGDVFSGKLQVIKF